MDGVESVKPTRMGEPGKMGQTEIFAYYGFKDPAEMNYRE